MTSSGSPYARFRRALKTGNLGLVLPAAAELRTLDLPDALAVLELIARDDADRYDRAAARFMRRLAVERALTFEQQRYAVAALELLPQEPATAEVLRRLI